MRSHRRLSVKFKISCKKINKRNSRTEVNFIAKYPKLYYSNALSHFYPHWHLVNRWWKLWDHFLPPQMTAPNKGAYTDGRQILGDCHPKSFTINSPLSWGLTVTVPSIIPISSPLVSSYNKVPLIQVLIKNPHYLNPT